MKVVVVVKPQPPSYVAARSQGVQPGVPTEVALGRCWQGSRGARQNGETRVSSPGDSRCGKHIARRTPRAEQTKVDSLPADGL